MQLGLLRYSVMRIIGVMRVMRVTVKKRGAAQGVDDDRRHGVGAKVVGVHGAHAKEQL